MRRVLLAIIAGILLLSASIAGAQVPPEQDGVVVHVPVINGSITVDGDLSDWAGIAAISTATGPLPSADPGVRGDLRWQVAATDSVLYFAATITDDVIIAGQNEDRFWNEDSIELYVNMSGDLAAASYLDGIAQIRFSAIDIGNTEPSGLTLTGNAEGSFPTEGVVFATQAGWGVEAVVDLGVVVEPGTSFGLQVHANGSSGGDRDLKLIWSAADVDDSSFTNPSLFGTAVFVDGASVSIPAQEDEQPISTDDDVLPAAEVEADPAEVVQSDGGVAQPTTPVEEQPESSGLLVAAIVSAGSILVGGLWFERRRKKSEAQLALSASAVIPEDEPTTEEVDEMIASILDD